MKKLCTKQGCGVCLSCADEYRESVLCRNEVTEKIFYQECVIEDMARYIANNTYGWKDYREVIDYFSEL